MYELTPPRITHMDDSNVESHLRRDRRHILSVSSKRKCIKRVFQKEGADLFAIFGDLSAKRNEYKYHPRALGSFRVSEIKLFSIHIRSMMNLLCAILNHICPAVCSLQRGDICIVTLKEGNRP